MTKFRPVGRMIFVNSVTAAFGRFVFKSCPVAAIACRVLLSVATPAVL